MARDAKRSKDGKVRISVRVNHRLDHEWLTLWMLDQWCAYGTEDWTKADLEKQLVFCLRFEGTDLKYLWQDVPEDEEATVVRMQKRFEGLLLEFWPNLLDNYSPMV